jgi:hypothetical protein
MVGDSDLRSPTGTMLVLVPVLSNFDKRPDWTGPDFQALLMVYVPFGIAIGTGDG